MKYIKHLQLAKARLDQKGDTIIEVMISVSVLAVVLGVAFALSTQSMREGTDANNRNIAVQLSQQQIASIQSLIKVSSSTPTFPSTFCMNSAGGAPAIDANTKDCNQSPFTIVDTFDSTHNTFTITTSWPSSNNGTKKVQLYYHSLNSQ